VSPRSATCFVDGCTGDDLDDMLLFNDLLA